MARRSDSGTYNRNTGLERGKGWVEMTRSGRWQARPGKGLPPLGTFDTKKSAIDALRHAVVVADEGTLDDYLSAFMRLRSTRWSERTLDNYRWYAERKISPAIGHLNLHQINQAVINEWWIEMSNATGTVRNREMSSGRPTCAKVWRFLRMVLKQADKDGLIFHPITEPVEGAGREYAPERVLLTEAQVRLLLGHLPPGRQIVAVLAATCGLRWSEILGLQRQNIDGENGVIWIERVISERIYSTMDESTMVESEPKTEASHRPVPVHPTVIDLIDRHLDTYVGDMSPTAYLVVTRHGTAVRRTTWGNQWRRARRLSGLDGLRPALGVHDLRHYALTHASTLTNQLREIMALAGHSTSAAATTTRGSTHRAIIHSTPAGTRESRSNPDHSPRLPVPNRPVLVRSPRRTRSRNVQLASQPAPLGNGPYAIGDPSHKVRRSRLGPVLERRVGELRVDTVAGAFGVGVVAAVRAEGGRRRK